MYSAGFCALSLTYKAGKSLEKRTLGLPVSRPGDTWGEISMATSLLPPHSGDRSKWFQLSILCTTLEIPNVS